MTNLEQKIWELCGSPMRKLGDIDYYKDYAPVFLHACTVPVEIGLAHVMRLLEPKILKINIIGNFLELL